MRKVISEPSFLGSTDIGAIELDAKSRDDIPALLIGLQAIYLDEATRRELFRLLEAHILPDRRRNTGRPGMDLWRILVMGVLKQGLRCDFDRLREIVNRHADVQAFPGHDVWFDPCRYELRNIRDNVALPAPELLGKAGDLVVGTGHKVTGKKLGAALVGRCGSFVVETDVHYPTDVNLLRDSALRLIREASRACGSFRVPGWRQRRHWDGRVGELFNGVVEEPVEEGRRDDGVSEDVAPFGEASVRGGDHRAFFATRICDLEEQACAALCDGQVSDFVDDEQRGPREEADFFGELALSFGFREAFGGFGEGRFVDAFSGFDGGDAEGGREVGFSGSRRSEEVDGFASPDEVELGQRGDSLAVERRLECEVEVFDRFGGEEFRGSQRDVDSSCFAQGAIFAEEGVDGFDGRELALLQTLQRGAKRFERPGHFQSDQGGTDAVDEFGHWRAPCRSRRRPTAS